MTNPLRRVLPILSLSILLFAESYAQQTIGLFKYDDHAQSGYILFSPMQPRDFFPTKKRNIYLIDKCGKEVHEWTSAYPPGTSVYLLKDGNLLRPGDVGNTYFNEGGQGGIIEKINWDSKVLWSYTISDSNQCQHHDICPLPNGNILAIVWEKKTAAQAIAAGIDTTKVGKTVWSEKIVEIHPKDPNGGSIVWEWHVWDHLVQDYNPSLPGYGSINEHPELININYANTSTDWLHINAIDYNPKLDQIILSIHNFSEIWIIDHSTTTAEAAGHSGGKYGKGGDLLYRWGNPQAYNSGTHADEKLFGQHDAHWIPGGLKDSGKIMVFNNGLGRPGGNYSSIDIINPPIDAFGNYSHTVGTSYLPKAAEWSYQADTPSTFYAANISGCQRLPNGNTLICNGPAGDFFEIDTNNNKVWDYVNPVNVNGPIKQGTVPFMNMVFRCTQYESNYPGLSGHSLIPTTPIELSPISYICYMETGVNAVQPPMDKLTAANPITNRIRLQTTKELKNTSIILTDITGRVVERWDNIHLYADQPAYFDISGNVIPGVYILSVSSSGYNQYIKLMKE